MRMGPVSGQWADAFIEFADTLVNDYDVVGLSEQLIDRLMALLPIAAVGMLLGDENATLRVFAASSEHARLLEVSRSSSTTWTAIPRAGRPSPRRPGSSGSGRCTRYRCGCARNGSGR